MYSFSILDLVLKKQIKFTPQNIFLSSSIDATKETGRLGRLVNHSRLIPNLQTKIVMLKGIPRLILVAKRDVEAGKL